MKKLKNIAIILIIFLAGYLMYDAFISRDNSKKLQKELDKQQETIDQAKDSIYKLNKKTLRLIDSIKKNELTVVEIEKREHSAKESVKRWRYSYSELKKLVPETQKDSLSNYIARDSVLNKENENLNIALVQCDSAKVIQGLVISDLKELNTIKYEVIIQKDVMLTAKDSIIGGLSDELQKSKRKSLLHKIGIILAFIGGLLI